MDLVQVVDVLLGPSDTPRWWLISWGQLWVYLFGSSGSGVADYDGGDAVRWEVGTATVDADGAVDWGRIVQAAVPCVLRGAAAAWPIVNAARQGLDPVGAALGPGYNLTGVHTLRAKPTAHALFVNHDPAARTLPLLGDMGAPDHTELPYMMYVIPLLGYTFG